MRKGGGRQVVGLVFFLVLLSQSLEVISAVRTTTLVTQEWIHGAHECHGARRHWSPPLSNSPLRAEKGIGGVDFSRVQMKSVPHKTCKLSDPNCKPVKPLLSVSLKSSDFKRGREGCEPPATNDAKARKYSPSYCVFKLLPQEAFWVNLNPNEPHKVMDPQMSATRTGKILLESDLWLKKTAAVYLHPDHALGDAFWRDLYGQVGKGKNGKLCYSLRQWIVPGEIKIAHTVNHMVDDDATRKGDARGRGEGEGRLTIHLLQARMSVKHESAFEEVLNTPSGKRIAEKVEAMMGRMCKDANLTLKRYAEERYEEMVLPQVEEHINYSEEYESLKYLFYWRIISEYAKSLGGTLGLVLPDHVDTDGETRRPIEDSSEYPNTNDQRSLALRLNSSFSVLHDPIMEEPPWSQESVFKSYVKSATKGEFLLKRQVEEEGVLYLRTYFHGAINWTEPLF